MTCEVCGRPVERISAGWAHAFSSAGALVAHDWSTTDHEPVPVDDGQEEQ